MITNLTNRSERTRTLSHSAGIVDVHTDEEIVHQADMIFSILVPSEASSLAQRFAPLLANNRKRLIYVDMNAIAPQTVQSMASFFSHENFVDGCIIGPPPNSTQDKTRLYLSGPCAERISDVFKSTDLITAQVIGNEIGKASAMKMCYASISKGTTAITIQACVTARAYGVQEAFFDELKDSMPSVFGALNKSITQVPPKAARWVGEMEEIAKTHAEIGLSGKTFDGIADTYRFIAHRTPLGEEILEHRQRGTTLDDALDIMVQSL